MGVISWPVGATSFIKVYNTTWKFISLLLRFVVVELALFWIKLRTYVTSACGILLSFLDFKDFGYIMVHVNKNFSGRCGFRKGTNFESRISSFF